MSSSRIKVRVLWLALLLLGTNGLPLRHADGSLIAPVTTYDDAGQVIRSTDALGRVSTTTYNAAGEATDSTVYDRDGAGNPVARTTHTDYDALGRAYKVTDALGRYSVTRFDDGGRAYQSERYNRNGVLLTTEQTHYDEAGRVDYTIDAAQNMKRMRYDTLGRLSAIILATQGQPTADGSGQYDLVTSFGYDELGQKIWQRDANNRVTRFGYDERGRQVWRAMPDGKIESSAYNNGGQLMSSSDFRGYTTTYGYDTRGRMILKQPDTRLRNSGEEVLTWSYPDENTRIAARGGVMTSYKSDAQRGWLSQVIGPNGTVNYGYNDGGERTEVATSTGTTSYSYDVQGRLWKVGDQAAGATSASLLATYGYDAVGNLSGIARGNGVITRYSFDELNRLSDMVHERDAVELSRFHYTVRADGKRTGLNESISNNTQTAGALPQSVRGVSYGYDNSGRLTSEVGNDGKGVSYDNAWSYDRVGNRIGSTLKSATQAAPGTLSRTTSISAVFNVNDWLTSQSSSINGGAATTQTWSYDFNGAELTQQVGTDTPQQNGWGFDGTLLGTGTQGTTSGGTSYSTDASGNRISVTTAQGQAAQKTTGYLLDENTNYAQVLEERAPDANDTGASLLQARYVWGGGLAPIAMWRRMPDGSAKLFYHLTDGQESVRQLTDANGAVTDSYFYDAWGNALAGGSGATANPFRYTGQMLDASGKYFLRARYYDSSTGRFLSQDPILGSSDDPITLHRYLYAGNDGVNFSDPGGEDFSLGGMLASTGISSSLRSEAVGIYTTIYDSAKDTLLYGPSVALHNLQVNALIGAALIGAVYTLPAVVTRAPAIRDYLRRLYRTAGRKINPLKFFKQGGGYVHDKRARDAAKDFLQGKVGQAARNIDPSQYTLQELDEVLQAQNFTRHPDGIVAGTTNVTQRYYTHPDGSMIRVKPDGDMGQAAFPRNYPYASRSYLRPGGTHENFDDELFKIDSAGRPVPASGHPNRMDADSQTTGILMQDVHVGLKGTS